MKIEEKAKSSAVDGIEIELMGSALKLSVKGNIGILPELKLHARMVIPSTVFMALLSIVNLQSGKLNLFLLFFSLLILILSVGLLFDVLIKVFRNHKVILITKTRVNSLTGQEMEIICHEPYKAIYIRPLSRHRKFSFSVILLAGSGKRVQLFEHLTQEQAIYIARVIHQYLKLDASEADFFEPVENQEQKAASNGR